MNIQIIKLESIDSTNTEAVKHARSGAPEGLCVIARQQTAGRGRQGRRWVSALDSGLYFTILLRPDIETQYLPLITLMAGVSVFETLTDFGVKPDIKWVNDILVNEKKIAGILSETTDTTMGLAVAVGIGINLNSTNFPQEISATATSLEEQVGRYIPADEVAQTLTRHLSHFYSVLKTDRREILQDWRARSTYFSGKAVRVTLEGTALDGITDGLEENGALRVTTMNGSVTIVQAGDVQLLRQVID